MADPSQSSGGIDSNTLLSMQLASTAATGGGGGGGGGGGAAGGEAKSPWDVLVDSANVAVARFMRMFTGAHLDLQNQGVVKDSNVGQGFSLSAPGGAVRDVSGGILAQFLNYFTRDPAPTGSDAGTGSDATGGGDAFASSGAGGGDFDSGGNFSLGGGSSMPAADDFMASYSGDKFTFVPVSREYLGEFSPPATGGGRDQGVDAMAL